MILSTSPMAAVRLDRLTRASSLSSGGKGESSAPAMAAVAGW